MMIKMKRHITILIAAICMFAMVGCGKTGEPTISVPDEIMLSWTEDPSTSQTISWRGETEYNGIALCNGKRYPAESIEIQKGKYYRYTAEITGLLPGETYQYWMGDGNVWSEKSDFTTEREGDFSFMYMGDIQYEVMEKDYKKWGGFIGDAYKNNPDTAFLLLGGDLVVNNSDLEEYEAVLKYGQPMFAQVPVMATPGNHETNVTPDRYKDLFALPENGPGQVKEEVYSFDYSNCHIVSLNSNLFHPERIASMGQTKWKAMMEQVTNWLESDLAGSKSEWTVVFMHHPLYPVLENLDIYDRIEAGWASIFEKYGVDVIFVGHQHVYMRTKPMNGVTYIMARSGEKYSRYYKLGDPIPKYVQILREINTYEMISVTRDELSVRAFASDGLLVDRWTKAK